MAADFLPGWYEPEYFNVETVFAEFFKPLLPDVNVVHWLKPGFYVPSYFEDSTKGTEPTLRLWRQPGERDPETGTDIPLVQFAAVTRSHEDSWDLQEFVFSMMMALDKGHLIVLSSGEKIRIRNVKLWLGPQTVPEAPIDEYFIPVTYSFSIDKKRLTPDYKKIVDSLTT